MSHYPQEITQPMEQELTAIGFQPLKTPEAVDALFADQATSALLVINSVCGCAAGNARPGVHQALTTASTIPDQLATVFAGVDLEATAQARTHLDRRPSSPAIALLKQGELVAFIPREEIEGHSAEDIAKKLERYFSEHLAN